MKEIPSLSNRTIWQGLKLLMYYLGMQHAGGSAKPYLIHDVQNR